VSDGAAGGDLIGATQAAHSLVEMCGMGEETGLRQYRSPEDGKYYGQISEEHKLRIDKEVSRIIDGCQKRARQILEENRDVVIMLRDELVQKGTLEVKSLKDLFPKMKTIEEEVAKDAAGEEKSNGEAAPAAAPEKEKRTRKAKAASE